MVHAPSPSRRHLARGGAPHQSLVVPLTTVGPDKTGQSSFRSFKLKLWVPVHFVWQHILATPPRTSTTSSMKGGNSGNNGSDLDMGNILKPTFNTLVEEGHKAFEAYLADLRELFLSHCKVTRQGTILLDTTSIIFNKPEVTPKVQPDPSPSHNDIQSMINTVLERQANSTDELLRRLIEERDLKKLDAISVRPLTMIFNL
jgi:hypothetical protein